jgi:hypothetical protein
MNDRKTVVSNLHVKNGGRSREGKQQNRTNEQMFKHEDESKKK